MHQPLPIQLNLNADLVGFTQRRPSQQPADFGELRLIVGAITRQQIDIRHGRCEVLDDCARGGECGVGLFAASLGLVEPTKASLDAPANRG